MKLNWAVLALVLTVTLLFVGAAGAAVAPQHAAIKQLLAVGPDAAGLEKAQKAVDALVAAGPKALPAILAAVPDDVEKANWLRAAFRRILDDAFRQKKSIPTDELLAFVNDKTKPGRSRRLALEAVEKVSRHHREGDRSRLERHRVWGGCRSRSGGGRPATVVATKQHSQQHGRTPRT